MKYHMLLISNVVDAPSSIYSTRTRSEQKTVDSLLKTSRAPDIPA